MYRPPESGKREERYEMIEAATVAGILNLNDYNTAQFEKRHEVYDLVQVDCVGESTDRLVTPQDRLGIVMAMQ